MRTRTSDEILVEHFSGAVGWLHRGYEGVFTIVRWGKPVARLAPFAYSGPGTPVSHVRDRLPRILDSYEEGLGYPLLVSYRDKVVARLQPIYKGQ